ncbi:hypothetical protein [Brachybacterium endophyticum]|nr:hypothetical protein [Brachybacterium endophyticum]
MRTPRPIPWPFSIAQAVLVWAAVLICALNWHDNDASSTPMMIIYLALMFGGIILGAVVHRRFLGPGIPRSSRSFLISVPGALLALGLMLSVVFFGLTFLTALAALASLALVIAVVRQEDVALWRSANEAHERRTAHGADGAPAGDPRPGPPLSSYPS